MPNPLAHRREQDALAREHTAERRRNFTRASDAIAHAIEWIDQDLHGITADELHEMMCEFLLENVSADLVRAVREM